MIKYIIVNFDQIYNTQLFQLKKSQALAVSNYLSNIYAVSCKGPQDDIYIYIRYVGRPQWPV